MCLCVKLESSALQDLLCKSAGSIDRELDLIDRSSWRFFFFFFAKFSNSTQARSTCRVLYFSLSIKGKTISTFWGCSLCGVCESLVRFTGICLYTYIGFPISRLMSRAWWSIQLLLQELKDIQAEVLVLVVNPREK